MLEVGPCVVTQVRTLEDGYAAVQLGFGERSEKNISKAMLGHFKELVSPKRHLVEFKVSTMSQSRNTLKVEDGNEGECVSVIGTSKGKGFQGVVGAGFAGVGQATRSTNHLRAPGSIGTIVPCMCIQRNAHGRSDG